MKLPPCSKYASSRESADSLLPKALDHDVPNEIPPMAIGETLIDAVGENIRCQPKGLVGLGGG